MKRFKNEDLCEFQPPHVVVRTRENLKHCDTCGKYISQRYRTRLLEMGLLQSFEHIPKKDHPWYRTPINPFKKNKVTQTTI